MLLNLQSMSCLASHASASLPCHLSRRLGSVLKTTLDQPSLCASSHQASSHTQLPHNQSLSPQFLNVVLFSRCQIPAVDQGRSPQEPRRRALNGNYRVEIHPVPTGTAWSDQGAVDFPPFPTVVVLSGFLNPKVHPPTRLTNGPNSGLWKQDNPCPPPA